MYDISGKMAPLVRGMAAGFDLWRRNSKKSEYVYYWFLIGYSCKYCSIHAVNLQAKFRALEDRVVVE